MRHFRNKNMCLWPFKRFCLVVGTYRTIVGSGLFFMRLVKEWEGMKSSQRFLKWCYGWCGHWSTMTGTRPGHDLHIKAYTSACRSVPTLCLMYSKQYVSTINAWQLCCWRLFSHDASHKGNERADHNCKTKRFFGDGLLSVTFLLISNSTKRHECIQTAKAIHYTVKTKY